jgi:hypothetical protein
MSSVRTPRSASAISVDDLHLVNQVSACAFIDTTQIRFGLYDVIGEVDFHRIKPSEVPSLIRFYIRNLAAGEKVSRLFHWRNSAPQRGNAPWGAWLAGELVGTLNTVPCPVIVGGDHFNWSWNLDSTVAEPFRHNGVGTSLAEYAAYGQPVVISKGLSESMYRLRKSIGFHDVPNSNYLIRVLDPWNLGGSRRRRFLAPFIKLMTSFNHPQPLKCEYEIRTIDAFGPSYDTFLEKDQGLTTLGPLKPASYLNWRYTGCPIHSYTILEAFQGNRILGAVVIRFPTESNGDAWLIDLICNLANSSSVQFLIDAAIQRASSENAATLLTLATSTRARTLLAQSGFVDTHTSPHFVFRPQSLEEANSLKSKEWNFWHGDGDAELYQS